jgi:hypothetical protein
LPPINRRDNESDDDRAVFPRDQTADDQRHAQERDQPVEILAILNGHCTPPVMDAAVHTLDARRLFDWVFLVAIVHTCR